MKPIMWTWSLTPPPHPEEARSAVSKDGRWHHISFAAVLRDARKSALLRTRFSDGSYDSNFGNGALARQAISRCFRRRAAPDSRSRAATRATPYPDSIL